MNLVIILAVGLWGVCQWFCQWWTEDECSSQFMSWSWCLWWNVYCQHHGVCHWDYGNVPSLQVENLINSSPIFDSGYSGCIVLSLDAIMWHCYVLYSTSSSTPAEDPLKLDECRLAGKYLLDLIKMDLKPQDIITPKSLHNAMVMVMALGGSTNAVLHLIAIARWDAGC